MKLTWDKLSESDDDPEGRILDEAEYITALSKREDIFGIPKETRFFFIQLCVFAVGLALCFWLNSRPVTIINSDFYSKAFMERMTKLAIKKNTPSLSQITFRREPGKRAKTAMIRATAEIIKNKPGLSGIKNGLGMEKKSEAGAKRIGSSSRARQEPAPATPMNDLAVNKSLDTELGEIDDLINRAVSDNKRGKYAQALVGFKRALSANPNNTTALAGAGDAYLYAGDIDSAENYYKKTLAIDPKISSAHNGLGTVLYYHSTLAADQAWADRMKITETRQYAETQFDSAIAEYTAAVSLDGSSVDALTNRGTLYDLHGDRGKAVDDYSRAIGINPAYALAYAKRGAIYKTLGRYKESIDDYSSAIRLDSGSYEFNPTLHFANAYFGRGIVYHKMGEFEKAIADFDSAAALIPSHSLAFLHKAMALDDDHRYEEAVAAYTKAIGLLSPAEYGGSKMTAYLLRGNDYKKLGNLEKAIEDYKSALTSSALAAKSCWRIAECYSLEKDERDALAWLRESVLRGFHDFQKWKKDKDLELLWNSAEFRSLTGM